MAQASSKGAATPAPPADRAALLAGLGGWLERRIGDACDLAIGDVVEPGQGFSNTTLCFRATWREAAGAPRERRLVARIQRDSGCPLLADIFHQWRVMAAIAANSEVAAPRLAWAEESPAVLGAPFFLMDWIEGRVPADYPSYHAEGWFADLPEADRSRGWWNAVAEMARLHRIDWRAFPFLAQGRTETPDAGFYLEHFVRRWFDWAANGRRYPFIEEAIAELERRKPATNQAGLVWNDARMGNTMFAADLSVAALLDFEVATLGPAEIDVGWWLYAEDIFTEHLGAPRNPAVPRREAARAGLERLYGRPLVDLDYFEALAALKHAVISIKAYGNDKKDDSGNSGGFAFATRRLERYLESA